VFFVCGYAETYNLDVSRTVIKDSDIPAQFEGKKIVFASDFHCGIFFGRDRMAKTVEKINSLNPDIIILGGDYVDRDKSYIGPCFEELAKLKAPLGTYAVLGNHDYGEDYKFSALITKAMRDSQITLLDNAGRWVDVGGGRIRIGGVSYYEADSAPALGGAPEGSFVILAAHNPLYIDEISDNLVDLVLSGHNHGGQVTFFGWAPLLSFWPERGYIKGEVNTSFTKAIVSSGIGVTALPVRFWARAEINEIILEP